LHVRLLDCVRSNQKLRSFLLCCEETEGFGLLRGGVGVTSVICFAVFSLRREVSCVFLLRDEEMQV